MSYPTIRTLAIFLQYEGTRTPNLFQNLRKSRLVDFNELLQFVEVIAEQPKPLVQRDIARGQLRSRGGAVLQRAALVEQGAQAEFELHEREEESVRVVALRIKRTRLEGKVFRSESDGQDALRLPSAGRTC